MKRRATKVILFLLLGAIFNVAVAWTLFRLEPLGEPAQPVIPGHRWMALRPFDDTNEAIEFVHKRSRGVWGWYGQSYGIGVDIAQSGWPMRTVEGGMWFRAKPIGNQMQVVAKHYEWAWPMRFAERGRYLPLAPIWPGFAINTIFYAAILWLLFVVPGAIRRRGRIERGLCARCAYPLGTSAVCSECGTAVHGAPPQAAPCNPRTDSRKPTAESPS